MRETFFAPRCPGCQTIAQLQEEKKAEKEEELAERKRESSRDVCVYISDQHPSQAAKDSLQTLTCSGARQTYCLTTLFSLFFYFIRIYSEVELKH